jgi:cupin 2 domain-containing protein
MIKAGNLLSDIPQELPAEQFTTLLAADHARVERIVSTGQVSPPGFWYDQEEAEWVLVLAGAASLEFAGEPALRQLAPGDYLHIPAHARHRVAWTDPARPTVWLAIHHR